MWPSGLGCADPSGPHGESHLDEVSLHEYEAYDHVLVASEKRAEQLRGKCDVPVEVMLRFSDPSRFFPDRSLAYEKDVLFFGNSGPHCREAAKACIENDIDVSVYGTLWEGIIPESHIRGQSISQRELRRYYASAKIVLNGHSPSTRESGSVSNCVCDVGMARGFLLTDGRYGIDEVFPGGVATYADGEDRKAKCEYYLRHPDERARIAERLHHLVMEHHTLDHRIRQIEPLLCNGRLEQASSNDGGGVAWHASD